MPDNNKDFELNNPSHAATDKAIQGETPPTFFEEDKLQVSGHREGEIKIAVPEPEILQKRVMTKEETKHYAKIDTEREQERIKALEAQVLQEWGNSYVPDWMRKMGMWILAAVAAILLLLTVGQITNFLVQLQALSTWAQWTIGILLVFVTGGILYLIIKLSLLYIKLQKNEQINLTALDALKERTALREIAQQASTKAVKKLKEYLKDYPVDSKKFLSLGFTLKEYNQIQNAHSKLTEDGKVEDLQRWLKQYKAGFQSTLDEIAHRRVKDYAKKTALQTAISPLPILDITIVLALSLSMVRDLMILYNLKMTTAGAGKVLLQAIAQVYLAGLAQDLATNLTDSFFDLVAGHLGQTTAKMGKIVGSKVGEGVANGVMIYRLGKATTKLLQPTS